MTTSRFAPAPLRALAAAALAATVSAQPACVMSNVFADHMVLQRSPQAASLWGFAAPGTSVTTTFQGNKYVAPTGADGVWRQALLPQSATAVPQSINISCSSGESFGLADVLFGDVVICGGQSNMQYTLSQLGDQGGYDAAAEIAAFAAYPNIRTMTVGQTTTSYSPLSQLAVPPIQPWASIANPHVIGLGNWSATSATCAFYGRYLYDALQIPIGLVSSNWGGTIIQSWSSNATNKICGLEGSANTAAEGLAGPDAFITPGFEERVRAGPDPNNGHGVLYNAMIYPFTVGPMALSSFTWFQGESNAGDNAGYACLQPAMITQWRADFNNAKAFFGFVELEPWITGPPASFRVAQAAALALPFVGYAQATDMGDPLGPDGSIHPRGKKTIGKRLAAAALSLQYGVPTTYKSPSFKSGKASGNGGSVSCVVSFADLPTTLVTAADHCKTENGVVAASCAGFTLTGSDHIAYNATATLSADSKSLVLSATAPAGVTAASTSFGFNSWPINTIMSAEGLPLQPWDATPCS